MPRYFIHIHVEAEAVDQQDAERLAAKFGDILFQEPETLVGHARFLSVASYR